MANNIPVADEPDISRPVKTIPGVSLYALGNSLGLLLAISFVLCILFDLLFPEYAMNRVWAPLLPGFTWLSWPGFLIGLVESFAYGWYVAVIFVPLFNFFSSRSARATQS